MSSKDEDLTGCNILQSNALNYLAALRQLEIFRKMFLCGEHMNLDVYFYSDAFEAQAVFTVVICVSLVMKKVVSVKATSFFFTRVIKVRALSFGSNKGVFLGATLSSSTVSDVRSECIRAASRVACRVAWKKPNASCGPLLWLSGGTSHYRIVN